MSIEEEIVFPTEDYTNWLSNTKELERKTYTNIII